MGLLGRMHAGLFGIVCFLTGILGAVVAFSAAATLVILIAPVKQTYGDPVLFTIFVLIGVVSPPMLLIQARFEQKRENRSSIMLEPSFSNKSTTSSTSRIEETEVLASSVEHNSHAQAPAPSFLEIRGYRLIAILGGLIITALVSGSLYLSISKAQNEPEFSDWQAAQREGSLEGYRGFLQLWPSSRFASEAARKFRLLDQAADNNLWKEAEAKRTREAYERYLQQYPTGANASKAIRAISEIAAAQPLSALAESQMKPLTEFRECTSCPKMVVLPAGEFLMGSPSSEISQQEAFENEAPQHKVSISRPFAIGKYEVTFAEWDACVLDGGCRGYRPGDEGRGRGSLPVMNVSWDDAKLYARWLSQKTGKVYRLPSEAEWEYAARAGSSGKFYFGNDEKSLCKYANVADESGSQTRRGSSGFGSWQICNDGYFNTAPVGGFAPNAFGLYDMLGNVGEWVEDVWHLNYVGAPVDGSAWLSGGDSQQRIGRGGSYYNLAAGVRSANRDNYRAGSQGELVGFRVARTVVP